MRYSVLMLASLTLATAPPPHSATVPVNSAYFCGSAPPDWTPPWQRKPVDTPANNAPCHIIICDRHAPRSKSRR